MSYVRQNIMDEEEVIMQMHVHWIVFVPWFLVTILVLSTMFFFPTNITMIIIVRVIAAGFFMKASASLIYFWTSEYGVTTRRVLGKTGLVRIRSVDILLQKVEAVKFEQGILGRIFDFADLIVTGTGGTVEVLTDVPNPMAVRNAIQEQVARDSQEGGSQIIGSNEG